MQVSLSWHLPEEVLVDPQMELILLHTHAGLVLRVEDAEKFS